MTDLINQIRHAQALTAEGAVVVNLQRMGLVKPLDPPEEVKAGLLTAEEETELLDWASACQSAYHIENTPGHRFGGLPGALAENRAALVECVNGLLALRAPSATPVRTFAPIERGGSQVDYLPQG